MFYTKLWRAWKKTNDARLAERGAIKVVTFVDVFRGGQRFDTHKATIRVTPLGHYQIYNTSGNFYIFDKYGGYIAGCKETFSDITPYNFEWEEGPKTKVAFCCR